MQPLTVRELIELLQEQDQDLPVRFSYNYGDHWRTEVAAKILSVEVGTVVHSEYHRMDKVLDPEKESEEDGEDADKTGEIQVLILR